MVQKLSLISWNLAAAAVAKESEEDNRFGWSRSPEAEALISPINYLTPSEVRITAQRERASSVSGSLIYRLVQKKGLFC